MHPQNVPDAALGSGWREETFDSFGVSFPVAMPWYFRTLDDWFAEFAAAGLEVTGTEEPVYAETMRPLSLLIEVGSARHTRRADRS